MYSCTFLIDYNFNSPEYHELCRVLDTLNAGFDADGVITNVLENSFHCATIDDEDPLFDTVRNIMDYISYNESYYQNASHDFTNDEVLKQWEDLEDGILHSVFNAAGNLPFLMQGLLPSMGNELTVYLAKDINLIELQTTYDVEFYGGQQDAMFYPS